MALRMAQPWVHPKTKVFYLRQRTPEDLLAHVLGQKLPLPVGSAMRTVKIGPTVQLSLQTKIADVAKERHAVADAALRRFWTRARRRQEAVRNRTEQIDDRPAPTTGWRAASERFGEAAGTVLEQGGLLNSDAHRAAIIAETANIFDRAAKMLGPGEIADALVAARKGPTAVGRASSPTPYSSIGQPLLTTVSGLWDAFAAAKEEMLAPTSMRRYAPCIASLAAYCGNRDIQTITGSDIFDWATHRRDADHILPRVINGNDLTAVRSVFAWAMSHQGGKRILTNPAQGIRLDEPRHLPTRERKFREAEIKAILTASLEAVPSVRNPSLSRAKRWCPWLAAYSGARIAELTALHGDDIWQEHGVWVMHFTKTKSRVPRMVPIHADLIDQGFLEVCKAVGDGPLFYDPAGRRKLDAITDPWANQAKAIATWVRKVANLDPEVDPNHGWRHTFKSLAVGIIDVRIRDHITGHSAGSVGRGYEQPEISRIAEALARFPRYKCPGRD